MTARAAELKIGRTFGVAMQDGDEFFTSLSQFCDENNIKQGYIPVFLGAFRNARIVGTCHNYDPELPMYEDYIEVDFVETVGAGTIAWDAETGKISPHVHLGIGKRIARCRRLYQSSIRRHRAILD